MSLRKSKSIDEEENTVATFHEQTLRAMKRLQELTFSPPPGKLARAISTRKQRNKRYVGTCPFRHDPSIGLVSSRHFYSRHGLYLTEHTISYGNTRKTGSAYQCVYCRRNTDTPFLAMEHLLEAHYPEANSGMTHHGYPDGWLMGTAPRLHVRVLTPQPPVEDTVEDVSQEELHGFAATLKKLLGLGGPPKTS